MDNSDDGILKRINQKEFNDLLTRSFFYFILLTIPLLLLVPERFGIFVLVVMLSICIGFPIIKRLRGAFQSDITVVIVTIIILAFNIFIFIVTWGFGFLISIGITNILLYLAPGKDDDDDEAENEKLSQSIVLNQITPVAAPVVTQYSSGPDPLAPADIQQPVVTQIPIGEQQTPPTVQSTPTV